MTQTGGVAESRLSDWISLGVLASWVPRDAVEGAVEAAGKTAKRKGGKLPPQVMAYFVMACVTRRELFRLEVEDLRRRVVAAT